MRASEGFEGNGQTLRILSKLEKFSQDSGADLTRRALLGTLKYPVAFEAGRHAKPQHKSFDCSIIDLTDEITFGVHDLEDVVAIRLIHKEEFMYFVAEFICKEFISGYIGTDYDRFVLMLFGTGLERKHAISRLVGYFIRHCFIRTVESLDNPMICYRASMHDEAYIFLNRLIALVREQVIFSEEVQQIEFKGQQLVIAVFEALKSDPQKLLPKNTREAYLEATDKMQHLCDYVAGMTDSFMSPTHERLFSPRVGSVFDKL